MSDQRTHGGLSVRTLLIAAGASAVAAVVVPLLWEPGTVFAAAMTPIVVALASEALRRPVETVSSVRVRRTDRATAAPRGRDDEPFDPLAPPPADELSALPHATAPPRVVHRRGPITPRQVKLGVATGLVAFLAAVGVVTASELVAGDAVTADGQRTTFFGGGGDGDERGKAAREEETRAPAEEEPEGPRAEPTETPAATETAVPTITPTPTASPVPRAAPEEPVAPAEPTPAP